MEPEFPLSPEFHGFRAEHKTGPERRTRDLHTLVLAFQIPYALQQGFTAGQTLRLVRSPCTDLAAPIPGFEIGRRRFVADLPYRANQLYLATTRFP